MTIEDRTQLGLLHREVNRFAALVLQLNDMINDGHITNDNNTLGKMLEEFSIHMHEINTKAIGFNLIHTWMPEFQDILRYLSYIIKNSNDIESQRLLSDAIQKFNKIDFDSLFDKIEEENNSYEYNQEYHLTGEVLV